MAKKEERFEGEAADSPGWSRQGLGRPHAEPWRPYKTPCKRQPSTV